MSLSPGSRLAQYEVTSTLGAGGMGEVYRARDLRLARDVAIKVMAAHIAADPMMRQRFETEARAVAALSHPSILSIHELGVVDGIPFAVMELLEGETLRARLHRGAIPWRDVVAVGAAIADGLAAAHLKGIVHRDLKPENVFLTSDGAVKILDFGLATHRFGGTAELPTGMLTMPGTVLGTFGYMSPEQVTGERVDGRSDIFAAGCVVFEMVTGRQLFPGSTPQEVIANVVSDSRPGLTVLDPVAPPEMRAIISRCVDRDPNRRFASATDLGMALRSLLTGSVGRPGTGRATTAKPRGKSLAILPFVNSSQDPQIEYLSDGITETIINSLSQLPGLRVVPRSLVFRYKGMTTDPSTVGLALNARTILTGHVAQQADFLNIQAELVDTVTETQLWGERFRQKASDVLALQEDIAWQISEALRLKLTGAQKKKLRKRATVNSEAYQEYLRGRHHWHNWSKESIQRAIGFFERALEHDPAFALAYAGLGNAFGALSYYGHIPPHEGFPRARAAALRALELDAKLSDAHVTLALERLFYGWDWPEAEAAIGKAVKLDPDSALAHTVRALIDVTCGRFDAALTGARRGRALDPLSPFINMGPAWVLHFAGRHDETIHELLDVLALKPGLEEAGNVLITSYETLGRFEEALAVIARQRCWQLSLNSETILEAYRSGGPNAYWRERLRQMEEQPAAPAAVAFSFAIGYTLLGDFDRAADHLQRMLDHHVGGSVFIGVDPVLIRMRGMPRYDAIVRAVGAPLPQMA